MRMEQPLDTRRNREPEDSSRRWCDRLGVVCNDFNESYPGSRSRWFGRQTMLFYHVRLSIWPDLTNGAELVPQLPRDATSLPEPFDCYITVYSCSCLPLNIFDSVDFWPLNCILEQQLKHAWILTTAPLQTPSATSLLSSLCPKSCWRLPLTASSLIPGLCLGPIDTILM